MSGNAYMRVSFTIIIIVRRVGFARVNIRIRTYILSLSLSSHTYTHSRVHTHERTHAHTNERTHAHTHTHTHREKVLNSLLIVTANPDRDAYKLL